MVGCEGEGFGGEGWQVWGLRRGKGGWEDGLFGVGCLGGVKVGFDEEEDGGERDGDGCLSWAMRFVYMWVEG